MSLHRMAFRVSGARLRRAELVAGGAGPVAGPVLILIVLAASACDAQVTPGYQGEPLAAIRGNIVAERTPPAAEAALLWWSARVVGAAAPGQVLETTVTTEGDPLTPFTLSVYRPPPEAALFHVPDVLAPTLDVPGLPAGGLACHAPPGTRAMPGDGRLAIAYVAAVSQGSAGDGLAQDVVGLATDFALVFAPVDLPTSAPGATFLVPASGSVLPPGYHLMRVERLDPAAAAPDALSCEGPDGAASLVRLRESTGEPGGTEIDIRIPAG